jgi:3-hydroxyisobutyrate dehydrogenase-like beta-hydroxyacid dehydrogenase
MGGDRQTRAGWIGLGRMGAILAGRLLDAGYDLAVYNRTRAKAEPLAARGATVVGRPRELAGCPVVFTMVAGSEDVREVIEDLLSGENVPELIVDSTTISPSVAAEIRSTVEARGVAMLAAPVSGNPKVAASGRLTIVASGPQDAFAQARPHLEVLARSVTYAGEGDSARLVKVCHNLMLGIVAQSMAEITVLAEKGGVSRAAFLAFLNDSVMGSTFTRYKSPAYVNLDFTPTFTPALLLKDFHLGMDAARELGVPMPLSAATEQIVQALEATHGNEVDFAALLAVAAAGAGLELRSEDVAVDDGLAAVEPGSNGAGRVSEETEARGPKSQTPPASNNRAGF